jgi:penicillin-binding protein activator
MKRSAAFAGLGLVLVSLVEPAAAQRRRPPPTVYSTPDSPGAVRGVGTESQDIVSMSDQMMRDMLTIPALMNANPAPRIIIDAKYFRNESSEIIDKALITDRIRVSLSRAAAGRVRFVGREYADASQMERDLKDSGAVDVATTGRTRAMAGADYRLVGRIGTRDSVDPRTGIKERYSVYTFELLDLEYNELIWSNLYEFKKATQDNVVYR